MNRSICFAILLGFTCMAAYAQNAGAIATRDLRESLQSYDRAWNGKATKAVGDMLDDKYVYFSSVGTLSDKRSTLEFLGKPDYKLTSVERSEIQLHSYDGKIAVISSRWRGKGRWSGGEIDDDQRCGQVLVKRDGKW